MATQFNPTALTTPYVSAPQGTTTQAGRSWPHPWIHMHYPRVRNTILTLLLTSAFLRSAELTAPWIASDRTVDCTSYETIKRDLKLADMRDEERALTLFHFFRQRVFHYANTSDSRDPIKCLNALGYTLCGSQATCMKGLLASCAGIKARIRSFPGHTFYEAFYDGKWHGYDTFDNFYVFTRGDNPSVASFEELAADPTLIGDAVKEGRAAPGMAPCGDDVMEFAKVKSEQNYEPLNRKYSPRVLRLRPGEQIVRSWWPDGRGIARLVTSAKKYGVVPLHTCGSRDKRDNPALFKFWEPYAIPDLGGCSRSYRHGTSGQINYAPDLTDPAFASSGVTLTGSKSTADGLSGLGELIVPINCPYYINSGVLVIDATCSDHDDAIAVSVEVGGKNANVLTAKTKGRHIYRIRFDEQLNADILHAYQTRLSISGGCTLHRMYLRTGFQWNAQSGPHLMPGRNQCTFTADNGGVLSTMPLSIRYRFRQAPTWSEECQEERIASSSPFSFDIMLPETGDKLPQMLDLTMTYGNLSWIPITTIPDRAICDLTTPDAVAAWKGSGPELTAVADNNAMLLAAAEHGNQVQKRLDFETPQDWSQYSTIVIEIENLGKEAQALVFRASSDTTPDFKERSDIELSAPSGKSTLRIPTSALRKSKISSINKIYIMLLRVPDGGSKLRISSLRLSGASDM